MEKSDNLGVLNINNSLYKTRLSSKFINRKRYTAIDPHIVLSFIPGTIVDVLVKPGQSVRKGDDLIILDAMKMKNIIKSNIDGKIRKIAVNKGEKVSKGNLLIELEI